MIYLNNAATTVIKPEGVKTAPPASADMAKAMVAQFLGVKSRENVMLTQGGAQAMELALRGFIKKGDHVIATAWEHDTTWAVLEELEKAGVQVSCIGVNPYGGLRYEEIEPLIQENTRAIVCAHGCAVTGNIADLEQVGGLARRHKLLLIADGCQAVGATSVNVESLGADVYCFTAHKKIMGPYGVGGLCLKEGLRPEWEAGLEAAGLLGRLTEIEPSEEKLGQLCAALAFIKEKGIYGISIFPHRLAKRFFESVSSMDAVKVYGDFGTGSRIPTVSIAVEGFTSTQVKEHMAKKYGIVVKDGFHDAARMHQALRIEAEGLCRFSFGYFNTRRDVNDTIWALMDLLGLDDLYLLA